MSAEAKKKKVSQILDEETGSKSYQAHKYSLDEDYLMDYGDSSASGFVWKRGGETDPPRKYKDLSEQAVLYAKRGEQSLTYFLDGSRHVYKVEDRAYPNGSRTLVYPTIAGQVAVGICKRKDKLMAREELHREFAISVPDKADANIKAGFYEALRDKLNASKELERILERGWKFSTPVTYDTKIDKRRFEDRGTARIQDIMVDREKAMVKKLVRAGKLDQNNYLVKDGSLEYRMRAEEQDKDRSFLSFKQNYNWVIGLSKKFNAEACFEKGKSNPGYIADLPLYSRTAVAYFAAEKEPLTFAVWYVRIRAEDKTRSPFDGILKVEKILALTEEVNGGMNTDTVDMLSAHIINERNPTCYGSDVRWANHIYPIYLTECFIKSQYLSSESFLHLF
ncbi:MAG: hypothetical protein LBT59_03725 [Clostridiales bacterium]|jgi:hypothetical protein|nr:hypothetical protein [Clostridiales bacterium]